MVNILNVNPPSQCKQDTRTQMFVLRAFTVYWEGLQTHPFRQLPVKRRFNIPDAETQFTVRALTRCLYLIPLKNSSYHNVTLGFDWLEAASQLSRWLFLLSLLLCFIIISASSDLDIMTVISESFWTVFSSFPSNVFCFEPKSTHATKCPIKAKSAFPQKTPWYIYLF